MNLKLNFTQIARIQIAILSISIFFVFLISGIFLYRNFYKTLTGAKEIIILRSQIALEEIDTILFDKVIKAIENKKTATEVNWTAFKNPFLPYKINLNQNEDTE